MDWQWLSSRPLLDADPTHMSINFRAKRRNSDTCDHATEIRMEIAGMSRSVCEECGRVSVGYVDHHIRQSLSTYAPANSAVS